jgi:hypothetical protein
VSKEQLLPPSGSLRFDAVNPIFENGKYKLYSINDLNLSKTNMLPSSKEFLTATRIAFRGNLTLVDKLNGRIYFNNTSGGIYPADEGEVIIHMNSSIENEENNIIALAPLINVHGDIILNDMKSTWGYFSEIKCTAEKLIISGNISFRIFNSFKSRIYMESFVYEGKYIAVPFPTYLRPDYAKEQIKNYLKTNHISPLGAMTTPLGILWALVIILVIIFLVRRQAYYKVSNFVKKAISAADYKFVGSYVDKSDVSCVTYR